MRISVTKYITLSLICKSLCMNKPRAMRVIAFIIIVRREMSRYIGTVAAND